MKKIIRIAIVLMLIFLCAVAYFRRRSDSPSDDVVAPEDTSIPQADITRVPQVIVRHPSADSATMFDRIDVCEGDPGTVGVIQNGQLCDILSGPTESPCGDVYGTYYELTCKGLRGFINVKWVDVQ